MTLLLRFLYRLYRILSSLRYWAQRRFTQAGLGVLTALVAAAMLGLDTDNNVVYQVFTLLLFLLLIAAGFSWTYGVKWSVARRLPRFGTVGRPLRYSLVVKNLAAKPQGGLVLLEKLADPRPSFEDWQATQFGAEHGSRSFRFSQPRRTNPFKPAAVKDLSLPLVAPNEEVEVAGEIMPLRRGLLRFEGVAVARPDPLGLCRALAKVALPQTALILPKRYALPSLALPGQHRYQAGGVALASNVGQSEDFIALRDYRHGDPVRHIHWRSWAKTGQPVVKEFEDEFFVRHGLVLDTFTSAQHSAVFEEAVSVAASFACTLLTQESLLDLLFVGAQSYCFTAGRGLAQADQMLEILASVAPCRNQLFRTLEHLVLNHSSVLSGCICVLMAWDEERREFVRKLRTLGVPVRVVVVVAPGQKEALDPGPMLAEPDAFCVLEVGRIEEGMANLK
jgi:uncharacterized protein (DUF58 family)